MGQLDEAGRRLLRALMDQLPKVRPGDPGTYVSYKDIHDKLGLPLLGGTFGRSLQIQGLNSLANWTASEGMPGVTGIVVARDTLRPGKGYFNLFRKSHKDIKWWADQVKLAKEFDWSPYIAAGEPKHKRSAPSFSALCEQLGCPLTNPRDRWSAFSAEKRRAVFTVWADHLRDGRYLFVRRGFSDSRIGARELRKHANAVLKTGVEAIGILCEAKDPRAEPRVRSRFEAEHVLVLRFTRELDGLVAYVQGEVPVDVAITGSIARGVRPLDSAIDDLDQPPPGRQQVVRTQYTMAGYRRDKAVREFVLKCANGECEYCHGRDFVMSDAQYYLEAHHVIRLADQGPDSVENVIALCARHHREAHYGKDAEFLEKDFLKIVSMPMEGRFARGSPTVASR